MPRLIVIPAELMDAAAQAGLKIPGEVQWVPMESVYRPPSPRKLFFLILCRQCSTADPVAHYASLPGVSSAIMQQITQVQMQSWKFMEVVQGPSPLWPPNRPVRLYYHWFGQCPGCLTIYWSAAIADD